MYVVYLCASIHNICIIYIYIYIYTYHAQRDLSMTHPACCFMDPEVWAACSGTPIQSWWVWKPGVDDHPLLLESHGVSTHGVTPIAGWFNGKSQSKMDDLEGYPYFRKPPYRYNDVCISCWCIDWEASHWEANTHKIVPSSIHQSLKRYWMSVLLADPRL